MSTWLRVLTLSILAVSVVPVAFAQEPESGPAPPHLAYADGTVDLELDGQIEAATPSTALLDGDRVRTHNGRAEIVYADGTVVHLDRDTLVEVMSPTRLRLTEGRLTVRTSAAIHESFVVDTAAASIEMSPRGEYAVTMDERRRDLTFAVARGLADADTWSGRVVVRAGEQAWVPESGAVQLTGYNSARWDAFDRWSAERINAFANTASASHLPYELRAHGPALDRHGSWGHVAAHGAVWFPRVGPGWRPYVEGRWRQTRYGLTWVGFDPWAWPTHHYGRWGFSGNVWFWIPARTWAPAWVSWAYAPSYVSWAPLGWDGRPVVAFSVGLGHNPWRAWTVLPRQRLTHRGSLRPWIVDGGRLPVRVRSGFRERSVAYDRSLRFDSPSRQREGATNRPGRGRTDAGRFERTDRVERTDLVERDRREQVRPGTPIRSPQRAFEDVRSGPNRPTPAGRAPGASAQERSTQRPFDATRAEGNRAIRMRTPSTEGPRPRTEAWDRDASRPTAVDRSPSRPSEVPVTVAPGSRNGGERSPRVRSPRVAPQSSPARPGGEPRLERASPPSSDREPAGRRAVPRASGGGESRPAAGTSAAPPPSSRGESRARSRPGGVRRPPG